VNSGISTNLLMENAGLAVAQKAWGILKEKLLAQCIVLAGPGNNGGDGLVMARHLHEWGIRVMVYICLPRPAEDDAVRLARKQGVPITDLENGDLTGLREHLESASLVVDAILGTGRARPIAGQLQEALSILHQVRRQRTHKLVLLALDLPTGLDANSGTVDPYCPRADTTVTLGYPKKGFYSFPGADYLGALQVADIGIPDQASRDISLELITTEWVAKTLPQRPRNSHKGTFGKALVVAGSRNFVGAAYLACSAAARVGTGKVTLATPASVHPILAAKLTESTHMPLPETKTGLIDVSAGPAVREVSKEYNVVLLGCGLGQSGTIQEFLRWVLLSDPQPNPPIVLDADALNNIAKEDTRWWKPIIAPTVLTPHVGEMARLSGLSVEEVQRDRIEVARKWAAEWNKIVVLKGAFTVIAAPDGITRVSPFASAVLASAGTGDVLSGIITGLIAQNLSPFHAACCGVHIHAKAGERLLHEIGEVGALAGDLLKEIPKVIKELKTSLYS